ncbi:MAG TPA: IS3 family transposase [Candidatus Eisenbacteria bacterium]|nr:IS3 family transposase [Candidatus Eisenbacteria bacterium]
METKRSRRVHTREFKAEAVALVRTGGRNAGQVARELGLADSLVRTWVRQAEVDAGKGPAGALTTAEKEELSQLRREVKVLRMEREILKKGGHLLRQGERVKFAFISEEKVAFPVAVLCRLLAVSPSGFYAAQGRPRSLHARRDDKLTEQVVGAHAASKGRYGSPRVHAELKAAGECVGRKRVARLMREKKLAARMRRRFRTTTDSKHDFPIAPNVLERDFTASAPDRAWVTDITFLWTAQGWLYLAVILDLFSRRVVGWATSQNVDRHLALAALDTALARRRPAAGLVHHSDRGSTYASSDYRKALNARGFECSMSRKGDCWDNAVAESFFSTLKRELEGIDDFESRAGATLSIGDYIDGFYNIQRRHSAINYTSPVEFELIHSVKRAAA